jgi:UDP-N-acetylmuramoyl-tripeptide--D-alanyl-D-alanine ligase
VDHRLQAATGASGVAILDDTYNSNPAGAAEALVALGALGGVGPEPDGSDAVADRRRLALVTPGMVELGSRQFEENRKFGAAAADVADQVLVVGRTNRRALVAGVGSVTGSPAQVMVVDHRDEAVEWVRKHLGPGDAVLYENDLPDHYP